MAETVAIITAVVSAAAGTTAAVQQSRAQKAAAERNEDIAERNAAVEEANARVAQEQALIEADKTRMRARRLAGSQRAAAAKSGRQIGATELSLMADSAVQSEIDALTAVYRGQLSSGQHRQRASHQRSEASLQRSIGSTATIGGVASAADSIFGTALTYASTRPKPSDNPSIA